MTVYDPDPDAWLFPLLVDRRQERAAHDNAWVELITCPECGATRKTWRRLDGLPAPRECPCKETSR